MGFNSGFKGLRRAKIRIRHSVTVTYIFYLMQNTLHQTAKENGVKGT